MKKTESKPVCNLKTEDASVKPIALCSSVADFTLKFANDLMAQSGVWFISFKHVIEEWLASGGKIVRKRQRPLGFIMPSLAYLKKNYGDMGIVLFGADTLVHEEALAEIKKEYKLVFLDAKSVHAESNELVEQVLSGEYCKLLEKAADVVVDCTDIKCAVNKVEKLLKK